MVILRDGDREVLLHPRGDIRLWLLPGGGVDAAAVREPWEETSTPDALILPAPRDGRKDAPLAGSPLPRTPYHHWIHNGENAAFRQQLGHARLPTFVGDLDGTAPYRLDHAGHPWSETASGKKPLGQRSIDTGDKDHQMPGCETESPGMTEMATQPYAVTMNGPRWLTMEIVLEGVTPVAALAWFTQAGKLRQWWGPQEVEIEPVPGGAYVVSWPKIGWTMRGQIANMSDTHLVYSWAWDHEPDLPARAVIVRAEERNGGSVVTITHGPFQQGEALPDEDQDRAAHLDGWKSFLPELKRVAEGWT